MHLPTWRLSQKEMSMSPPLTNERLDTGAVQSGDCEARGHVPQSSWPGGSPEARDPSSEMSLVSYLNPGVLHATLHRGSSSIGLVGSLDVVIMRSKLALGMVAPCQCKAIAV